MYISKFNHEGYYDPTAYEALNNVERDRRQKELEKLASTINGFRPLVYICSPYAVGGIRKNHDLTKSYCQFAVNNGSNPFAPNLYFPEFLDHAKPDDRVLANKLSLTFLTKCTELWVFGDYVSPSMETEISKAQRRGMKIRYFTTECKEICA